MEPKTSQITPEVDFPRCCIDYHFAKGIFSQYVSLPTLGKRSLMRDFVKDIYKPLSNRLTWYYGKTQNTKKSTAENMGVSHRHNCSKLQYFCFALSMTATYD